MPRYVIDPATGIKTKISGTNYIPPCVAKNEAKKAKQETAAEPVAKPEPSEPQAQET
jgi:hypothetical protein